MRHHSHPPTRKLLGHLAQVAGEGGGAGDHVEQDVPLRAQDHQRRQPDIGAQVEIHDDQHERREQQVGREAPRGTAPPAAPAAPTPDADRSRPRSAPRSSWPAPSAPPPGQRDQPEHHRRPHVGPGQRRRRRTAAMRAMAQASTRNSSASQSASTRRDDRGIALAARGCRPSDSRSPPSMPWQRRRSRAPSPTASACAASAQHPGVDGGGGSRRLEAKFR